MGEGVTARSARTHRNRYENGRTDNIQKRVPWRLLNVCNECLSALRKHRLPKHSLANGLWVGDVPDVLRDLTFCEKLLVSLERHNNFIAKVTMGQYKMSTNAVVFSQPVSKVYQRLPPPKADIADCLAILYVGPCKPTPKDMKRTPFIIRRNAVLKALKWLVLNNEIMRI
ncbi:hypothetical protein C8Q79DRAFT_900724 [Trametes meyenii]|nr:hypothetical protein C8Q79DRAFT_900724 [Trametes meyenii]